MRSFKNLVAPALALAVLLGCGGGGEADGEASPVEEESMADVQPAPELACWLSGETSMEEAMERPSPLGETEVVLGDPVGKLCYGRPSARGRMVEGGLIPFGSAWRLGADEATSIHLAVPAVVGGIELEPGSYSLYTIAEEAEWEIFINAEAERWGIPINDAVTASNLGSFTIPAETLDEPVEQLTASWEAQGPDSGDVILEWGNTRVRVEVSLPDQAG